MINAIFINKNPILMVMTLHRGHAAPSKQLTWLWAVWFLDLDIFESWETQKQDKKGREDT